MLDGYDPESLARWKLPLLVVDRQLVIRDFNRAYLDAIGRPGEEVLGAAIFEAFPDSPCNRAASGVTNLNASFETVFRENRADRMPLQRHDIPSASDTSTFLRRYWLPCNAPLRDDTGRVVGVILCSEDVTAEIDFLRDAVLRLPADELDFEPWLLEVTASVEDAVRDRNCRVTAEQFRQALESRFVTEQAKAIIASRDDLSLGEAFARIRTSAQERDLRIDQVARALVSSI